MVRQDTKIFSTCLLEAGFEVDICLPTASFSHSFGALFDSTDCYSAGLNLCVTSFKV